MEIGRTKIGMRLRKRGASGSIIEITSNPHEAVGTAHNVVRYRKVSPTTGKVYGRTGVLQSWLLSTLYTELVVKPDDSNTKDIVDLKRWEEWRNQAMVPGKTGMGNTPMECLTKEGRRVRELLTNFLGIAPKYQAASYKHFYFKWDVLNKEFKGENAAIVGDLLTDEGHEVKVEQTDLYLKITFEHVTVIPKKERSRIRGREAIEIPRYGENQLNEVQDV